TQYPRKNWSSLMLMNNALLRAWTKEAVETQTGAWLHRFEPIPDEQIGDISTEWYVLDHMTGPTKLLHDTSGGPWLPGCEDAGYAARTRPAELACDHTALSDAAAQPSDEPEAEGDVGVCQPTTPSRTSESTVEAANRIRAAEPDSLATAAPVHDRPSLYDNAD